MDKATLEAVRGLEARAEKIKADSDAQMTELLRIVAKLKGSDAIPNTAAQPEVRVANQPSASSSIRKNQFRGMRRNMALEFYMRARADDGRIPLANVVLDLIAGGLEMGPHRDRWERQIMVTAMENPRVFGYDRDRRELWLAATAYETPRAKARGKGKKLVMGSRRAG